RRAVGSLRRPRGQGEQGRRLATTTTFLGGARRVSLLQCDRSSRRDLVLPGATLRVRDPRCSTAVAVLANYASEPSRATSLARPAHCPDPNRGRVLIRASIPSVSSTVNLYRWPPTVTD